MKNGKILLSVKKLFNPYKKNVIIVSIIMILTSICSFINPWLTQQLVDVGIMKNNYSKTLQFVGLTLAIFLIQQLFGLIQFYYYKNISIRIPYDLNIQACKHVLSVRIKYFKDRNFSVVMSELFQDIANISSLTDTQFLTSFVTLFQIVAGIIALFLINWKLTIIMIATIPIKILLSNLLFKKQESVFKLIMQVQSRFSGWLGDAISGIVEIKTYGIIGKKLSKLKEILEDSNKTKSKLMLYGYIDNISGTTLSIIFTCILYLVGAKLIKNNEMTFGSLVAFVSYSALVFEPIKIISYLIRQISSIKPAFERYLEFLNADAEKDNSDSIELPDSMEIEHIKFENVSLDYEQKKALDNVSFTINKGENAAIIGFNGSGKTSIINLCLRLYEPNKGNIKINDKDIKSFTFESYRSIWSLMAQSNYLFNDSIKNNINITEDLTMDEITNSCKMSGANSFIQKLQEKFDTRVGYNGAMLSGGEKQKVALARTLARKNTKILLLDEATSSYDYYSEQIFNKEILSANCYNFTITITHRPEVLKKLDKIIYLDKGKVIGIGTFDELYKTQKGFRNMIVSSQQEEKKNAI